MPNAFRSAALRILVLLLPTSFALGQEFNLRGPFKSAVVAPPRTAPETFGTSTVVYTVWVPEFQVVDTPPVVEGDQDGSTAARRCASTGCSFLGAAHLPNGAAITSIELEGCDGSATTELQYVLLRAPSPTQPLQLLSILTGTGEAETPGCALFSSLTIPHTVDNNTNAYAVLVGVPGDPDVSVSAVRIRYNLQVSPAPGTATFNDVPTDHPQFQFVEALVASGITAGCGGGNYCPDANLTRGQMAVFLAKALGLHFPN
jgi:hypothetical protein